MTDRAEERADARERFRAIADAEWTWRMAELGTEFYWTAESVDDFLPQVDDEAWLARGRRWADVLAEVEAIDPDSLDDRTRVDRAVYVDQLRTLIAQVDHRMHERPANADTAFWGEHSGRARRALRDLDEADRCLAQLAEVPRWFEQHIVNMRAGLARGFAPPRVTMAGREGPCASVARAERAEDTPYLAQFEELPLVLGREREARIAAARERIETVVIPAFRMLLDFLEREYLPALPETLGACDSTGGRPFYLAQLREFTTVDLSPEEIHSLGLSEVAAITAEMEEIARETGHGGDARALLTAMREDPSQYVDTPRALLAEASLHAKRFDAVVHRWFGQTPRQRFGIVEPPADLAPFYTFGRGGLDAYTLNTYNLPARPLYSLPALTLHEAAPGHCFQIALAHEADDLPPFRRNVYISAYGEGWALYTERLGVEMGMYETAYERMGMLSFQMWRAARLVIDTGIHAFGWTRERAQAYLRDRTAIAEHEIVTEVDRYIAWPGQATAYHVGQLTILRLRREAEERCGTDFDIRRFHDHVLALGSVPLDVLEAEVRRDIAAQERKARERDAAEGDEQDASVLAGAEASA